MIEGVLWEISRSLSNCQKMRLTDTIYDIWVAAQPIAQEIRAGQFVGIICDGKPLRRPISICESDPLNGAIRLVFEVRGEGTRWLSQQEKGAKLDILGPLGNGFPVFPPEKKVVFAGGGIGVPPLLMTCRPFGKMQMSILDVKLTKIGS